MRPVWAIERWCLRREKPYGRLKEKGPAELCPARDCQRAAAVAVVAGAMGTTSTSVLSYSGVLGAGCGDQEVCTRSWRIMRLLPKVACVYSDP